MIVTSYIINEDDALKAKYTRLVVVVVVAILVIFGVVAIAYYVYRNQRLRIAQQEDEIAFHKMSDKGDDEVQRNVVMDDKGTRGFATFNTKANVDDDDDDEEEEEEA
eukprot:TRINITY_DN31039_c0_g1_i1.p2 TRINITY_DN31039_c0_g1~~TRINITY_DN31039_c0_g1_i1.p2  ORF type:complete len:107 (+),score=18.05 TRINITY_DN31039_c0_g1_i1:160-480(+)